MRTRNAKRPNSRPPSSEVEKQLEALEIEKKLLEAEAKSVGVETRDARTSYTAVVSESGLLGG